VKELSLGAILNAVLFRWGLISPGEFFIARRERM
jgi:hypothetical protein